MLTCKANTPFQFRVNILAERSKKRLWPKQKTKAAQIGAAPLGSWKAIEWLLGI
jgi:hypothetical protein